MGSSHAHARYIGYTAAAAAPIDNIKESKNIKGSDFFSCLFLLYYAR
jgi:hypothetical protein